MSYSQKELESILDSIVKIGSESETLKPFMDEYYAFFQKVDSLRQKYYSFMGIIREPDLVKEISTQFTGLEQLAMSNAKDLLVICYNHKDDEGFHPSEEELGNIFKLCSGTRDRITSFETLLTAFMPTGR